MENTLFILEKRLALKTISENMTADVRSLGIWFYHIWYISYAACAIYCINWKPLPEKLGRTQNEMKQIEDSSEWIDLPTKDYLPIFAAI